MQTHKLALLFVLTVSLSGIFTAEASAQGAGTELKQIFARVGFVPAPDCICNETARIMDSHPAQWSRQNIQWIEGRIKLAAPKLGVKYRPVLVRKSVMLAVRRAARNERR